MASIWQNIPLPIDDGDEYDDAADADEDEKNNNGNPFYNVTVDYPGDADEDDYDDDLRERR